MTDPEIRKGLAGVVVDETAMLKLVGRRPR